MPAIAHLGVGFAAKRIAPKVSVLYLIIAAELIEIIFMTLWILGVEYPPQPDSIPFSPYSHSLIMGIVWAILAGLITALITKKQKISIIIGLLVFSHTLLDVIASPKTAFYPTDTGMPIFFNSSFTIGLGLWKYNVIAAIGEIGILITGIVIYILTLKKIKKEKNYERN